MRRFAVGLASASVLTLFAGGAVSASTTIRPVTHARGEVHRIAAALPGSVTLYDQNDQDTGVAVISSYFTDDFDSFSTYGADDFTVPEGHKWIIHQVEVSGAYNSANGPASSENVLFYTDKKGLPGKQVVACNDIKGKDNQGSFAIRLPQSCKVRLKGGKRYWVSVVANIDFACCGQWDWETRDGQNGDPAALENPNGGFDVCPTWDVMQSCLGSGGEGPDFMFTLKGKDVAQ